MQFPKIKTNNTQKTYQVKFGGLDKREGAQDGSILNMTNMSSREYPVLATRDARKTYTDNTSGRPDTLGSPNGLVGGDYLAWVDGTTFYYNNVAKGTVADSEKHFALCNNMLCIFPDNKYYNVAGTYKYTSAAGALTFTATTISHADAVFGDFKVGDEVSITGCTTQTGNNKLATIVSIGADKKSLVFAADTFTAASPEAGVVVIDIFGNLGATYTSGAGEITFQDGEYADSRADANTIYHPTVDFNDYFAVNEALTISGANSDKNNSPYILPIIREISEDGHYIRFYENVFDLENTTTYKEQTLEDYDETFASVAFYAGAVKPSISAGQYTVAQTTKITIDAAGASAAVNKYFINKSTTSGNQTGSTMYKIIDARYSDSRLYFTVEVYFAARYNTDAGAITLTRTIPTLNYVFENANRLWGIDTADNSIRCCFLGNPKIWDNFDLLSTSAWQASVGSAGSFTGGGMYGRKPVFHKELGLIEVFGDKPTNFGYKQVANLGAMSGCSASIQTAGEMMIYLSRQGFMGYTGGDPFPIGAELGDGWQNAVAGSTGRRYYVSVSDGTNQHLLVYDTLLRVWHREDDTTVTHWAYTNDLYFLNDDGDIVCVEPLNATGTTETSIAYLIETNDFTDNSPNKKGLNKVQIRLYVADGATCVVKLSTNGGAYSTLKTITAGAKQSYFVNFTPKRADHYSLKFEGTGTVLIYGMSIQRWQGSEI